MRRLLYPALLMIGVVVILPLAWMLSSSFKNISEIFSYPPELVPPVFRLDNYSYLWRGTSSANFPGWFWNSTLVAMCRLVSSLFFCSLAGFGFAKYSFRGRGFLFAVLLASMTIPFHVVLIPVYALMIHLGWTDTYQALIVPFVASAFGVFLMRQYMVGISGEFIDAARIDGASDFRIYWQIFLPLSKPALAALAIVTFRSSWGSYLWPMIILSSPEKFTIPMGILGLVGNVSEEQMWGAVMAASTLSVLPILALFILMQRQFVSGLTLGGVRK